MLCTGAWRGFLRPRTETLFDSTFRLAEFYKFGQLFYRNLNFKFYTQQPKRKKYLDFWGNL